MAMDLGLRGKSALVCAGSKGLGRGCAMALAEAGVDIVLNARGAAALHATADDLQALGVRVTPVVADVTTAEGQALVIAAAQGVDILVTNAGGPPPGDWAGFTAAQFTAALQANMLTPIALMQALVPAMQARGWGRVVNITSTSVKAPIADLGLSNTARTGLTGFVAGMARAVAPDGVCVNNLLPGVHATDRIVSFDAASAARTGATPAATAAARAATIPARRYGTAEDFGAVCAFLCSIQAGFIVGQNIVVDGGALVATI
jgi:3-oxoacyl-[acyl-carrier protein] reductase